MLHLSKRHRETVMAKQLPAASCPCVFEQTRKGEGTHRCLGTAEDIEDQKRRQAAEQAGIEPSCSRRGREALLSAMTSPSKPEAKHQSTESARGETKEVTPTPGAEGDPGAEGEQSDPTWDLMGPPPGRRQGTHT